MSVPADQTDTIGTFIPLVVHRVRFSLKLERACILPPFLGSTLRGLIGHGLRKALCVTLQSSCDGCQLHSGCDYVSFFESPATGERQLRRYSAVPHPWVLETDPFPSKENKELRKRDTTHFTLNLLGNTVEKLPLLILALRRAGQLGLGRQNIPFHVERICHERIPGSGTWQLIDLHSTPTFDTSIEALSIPTPARGEIQVRFLSPLRMKRDNKLVKAANFSMELFLQSLRLRIRELVELYGMAGHKSILPAIPSEPERAVMEQSIEWQDWTRYSNRQKAAMKMGGIVGHLNLDLTNLEDWWPLIWFGQWIHVGKQTSMGLGHYKIITSL